MPRVAGMKTYIAIRDLADPKKALANMPEKENEIVLGTMIGEVSKPVERRQPDESVRIGMGGIFEAIPADTEKEATRSGVCYLPEAFMDPILEELATAHKEDKSSKIRFGLEVRLIRATNPQGYSYKVIPVFEADKVDPLQDIRKELPATAAAKQIEGVKETAAKK